jgi:hypothetical protein
MNKLSSLLWSLLAVLACGDAGASTRAEQSDGAPAQRATGGVGDVAPPGLQQAATAGSSGRPGPVTSSAGAVSGGAGTGPLSQQTSSSSCYKPTAIAKDADGYLLELVQK